MSNNPYLHEEVYRGKEAMQKIAKPHVIICGVGAIGSILCDTLIRQGFRNITALDYDRAEMHNVQSQLYGMDDVGKLKTQALAQKLYLATKVMIKQFDKKLEGHNLDKALKSGDIIVDCFDNSASRKLLNDWAKRNKRHCLNAGVIEGYGEVVWEQDYRVPDDAKTEDGVAPCDYAMSRNLITFVVSMMAEELQSFVITGVKRKGFRITLNDMKIGSYK